MILMSFLRREITYFKNLLLKHIEVYEVYMADLTKTICQLGLVVLSMQFGVVVSTMSPRNCDNLPQA